MGEGNAPQQPANTHPVALAEARSEEAFRDVLSDEVIFNLRHEDEKEADGRSHGHEGTERTGRWRVKAVGILRRRAGEVHVDMAVAVTDQLENSSRLRGLGR